jgi:hypothetical protein
MPVLARDEAAALLRGQVSNLRVAVKRLLREQPGLKPPAWVEEGE